MRTLDPWVPGIAVQRRLPRDLTEVLVHLLLTQAEVLQPVPMRGPCLPCPALLMHGRHRRARLRRQSEPEVLVHKGNRAERIRNEVFVRDVVELRRVIPPPSGTELLRPARPQLELRLADDLAAELVRP